MVNVNHFLPNIAEQIHKQLPKLDQKLISASLIENYLVREDFIEGGQGYLTAEEYRTKTVLFPDELPHPLLSLVEFLAESRVVIGSLNLTGESSGDVFKLLAKCTWVDFQSCIIDVEDFPTLNFVYTFLSCTFNKNYRLGLRDLEVTGVLKRHAAFSQVFRDCVFQKNLLIDGRFSDAKLLNLFATLVVECEFESFTISDFQISNNPLVVKKDQENPGNHFHASQITLSRCRFSSDVSMGGMAVNSVLISGCAFLAKFSVDFIGDCERFLLTDCKFESSFSATYLKVTKLHVSACSFEHFCVFSGITCDTALFSQVSFQYALDLAEAEIKQDLSFQGVVFNKASNFLNVHFSKQAIGQIDRETFRLIKYSFESVGNQIEAGRFYAHEMEAYRRELAVDKNAKTSEKWLLGFNRLVSNHGQSYWRPIMWILAATGLLKFLKMAQEKAWLYAFCEPCNPCFATVSGVLNGLVKDLPLFKHLVVEGIEFLSLLIGLLMSAFVWQALVAFRRYAKR